MLTAGDWDLRKMAGPSCFVWLRPQVDIRSWEQKISRADPIVHPSKTLPVPYSSLCPNCQNILRTSYGVCMELVFSM